MGFAWVHADTPDLLLTELIPSGTFCPSLITVIAAAATATIVLPQIKMREPPKRIGDPHLVPGW